MSSPDDGRDPLAEDPLCIRCLVAKPVKELDRSLWCEECVAVARRRAVIRGWISGGVLALVLGLYIALWIRPDYSLIPTAWAMVLAVAFYLGSRVAREFIFFWERLRNRRAVEAIPPAGDPEEEEGVERTWD